MCTDFSTSFYILYISAFVCCFSSQVVILAEEHAENLQLSRFIQYVIGKYLKTPNTFFFNSVHHAVKSV